MRTLFIVLLLAVSAFGQTTPQQGPPPGNLTRQPDGHFSANSEPANPAAFEVHVVQPGETLSGIAGQVLNNSRLWPQLWETNEHVVNPHWIYPNDKILVRPITLITEATPPAPEPAPAPAVAAPAEPAQTAPVAPQAPAAVPPAQPVPQRPQTFLQLPPPRPVPEVKVSDLYCSGFIQVSAIPQDTKVIAKFNADGGALATESDYIYLSQGAEDGVTTGTMYQVVRPTRRINRSERGTADARNLGMHYLDVGQIQVVLTQPDFALGRVVSNCDAVEVGDLMVPVPRLTAPNLPRPRSFSPFMKATGDVKGSIVTTLNVLRNFGSTFKGTGKMAGVPVGELSPLNSGIGSQGMIVYVDIGDREGVKAGDLFIVYRSLGLDRQLYDLPAEAETLQGQRTAIGELVIVRPGERASTALVTYATDGLVAGDFVERR